MPDTTSIHDECGTITRLLWVLRPPCETLENWWRRSDLLGIISEARCLTRGFLTAPMGITAACAGYPPPILLGQTQLLLIARFGQCGAKTVWETFTGRQASGAKNRVTQGGGLGSRSRERFVHLDWFPLQL